MIAHPTKKELEAQKRYPTVDQIFATTDLGPLGIPEKSDQNWIAMKSRRSHFRDRDSRSSYQPTNNTAANAARLEELSPKPVDPEVDREGRPYSDTSGQASTAGGGQVEPTPTA